jgi:malonate transporter and related proteins
MAVVIAALLPVFLLIVLGFILKRSLMRLWFGLAGTSLMIVAICSAVPTSPSAYVLARQMGGDAPLLAQIITLLAAITMPVAIAWVS